MTSGKRIVVSLFSGAGGFDWGFHRAGFETRLAVELEKSPAETLAYNLKLKTLHTPISPTLDELPAVIQGDVREVDFSSLVSMQPDVLIGGPPCQDFSISKGGKREGLNGGRGKLYLEFLRALMFLQPKMFVFENVPGFTSANAGLAYQTVLDDIHNLEAHRREALTAEHLVKLPHQSVCGYDVLFRDVVDASYLGVAQTRRRLIIVGIRSDLTLPFDGLVGKLSDSIGNVLNGSSWKFKRFPMTTLEIFEGQSLRNLQSRYKEIMGAFSSLGVESTSMQAAQWRENVWSKLSPELDVIKDYYTACGLNFDRDYNLDEFTAAMEEHEKLLQRLGWYGKPVYELTDPNNVLPKQSEIVKDRMFQIPPGENAEFVDGTEWEVTSKEISFIYRRSYPLQPAWTVMAYGGGGTYGYHYERNRQMLTLRERARIQTFSDDFVFKGNGVRAQIGEAVPPLLGEYIAFAVRAVLDGIDSNIPD
jgi:DNA (cytosine-5)-methyltransferase 1